MTLFHNDDDEQEQPPGEQSPEPPCPQESHPRESSATDSPGEDAGTAPETETERSDTAELAEHPEADQGAEPAPKAETAPAAEPVQAAGSAPGVEPARSSGHDCDCAKQPPQSLAHLIQKLVYLVLGDLPAGQRALAALALFLVIPSVPVLGIWAVAAHSDIGWGVMVLVVLGAVTLNSRARALIKSFDSTDIGAGDSAKDAHKKGRKRGKGKGEGKKPKKD